MNDEPVISMRDVTKVYPGKVVLDRLEFGVPGGSVVGLLGKNGAGKSTLIKCLLGLVRAQAGSITVLGEPAWNLSAEAKARIGYVPQNVELYPWMKVRQMIAYTASFYSRWNHSLVERLAREWDLPLEDRIGALSVGSRQKVGILLALGHEPDLLVLDEPAASLDPAARREFLAEMLGIADAGRRTVLLSTHITSDIERVADRVAILKDGKIIFHDELDALKEQVKQVSLRSAHPLPPRLDVPGVLRQRIEGPNALLSVRHASPELVANLQSRWEASVELRDLNLEDIFLEMHDE